jgi:acetamidase/formamidase
MSDLETITYRPRAGEYAWTFGGAAPVMRIKTPCVLDLYTEDCFAGRVQSDRDLVSSLNITGLNPQTGPFWVEGAEPGDAVAVHFVPMSPMHGTVGVAPARARWLRHRKRACGRAPGGVSWRITTIGIDRAARDHSVGRGRTHSPERTHGT